MFARLAIRNVKRQIHSYLIYFVTVALSIALMFAINNLSFSDRIRQLTEISSDMNAMFTMVTILACMVTALVLSYSTGFMLKLRKKEFGMYLTLGMTRRNIRTLFVFETGLLSFFALIVGMGAGLVGYQLLMALFSSIMELPFKISAYSAEAIALTIAVSLGLFILSTLASLRYLRRAAMAELLKADAPEQSEKHRALWGILSAASLAGLIASLVITYRNLMAAFRNQDSVILLLWLVIDLAMIFLFHFTWSRSITGILLRNKGLKNRGANTVVLRGLSAKITVNSLMIGMLATLLTFAIVMSNVAFGEKIYSDYSVKKDCPYDVIALLGDGQGTAMEEVEQIVERCSPIVSRIDFSLNSLGETTLCSAVIGYDLMGWTDKYMALSQFNALLEGCGYEPIRLEDEYLLVTLVKGICETDFSDRKVTLNEKTYSWAGSSDSYPEFVRSELVYFVVPDEALEGMPVTDICAACTLENSRIDAAGLVGDLERLSNPDGGQEKNYFSVQEYYRLYKNATAGTLIIGTLYVSTVFVCMALAILSIKTLSTLDDERKRFAVLYRLGADEKAQKSALIKQIGAFFLMPFGLPFFTTLPLGLVFGKIYEIWGFTGLGGQKALETAVMISLAVAGVFVLYFFITYRVACGQVLCHGGDGREDYR